MKVGNQSILFDNVYIKDTSTIVGPMENSGPLRNYFDEAINDLYLGCKSFEEAEILLTEKAIKNLLSKTLLKENDVELAIGGDLINQDASSNYALRNFNIPFVGIYGACSTSILALIEAAISIDSKNYNNCLAFSSSHNLSAERQFRNPNEYGGAKPETSTYTVTGACACLVTSSKTKVRIKEATIGRIIDVGYKNSADLGRAMAPAACETILAHFADFNTTPSDYDLILTGDLSLYGMQIVKEIVGNKYKDFRNYNDTGLMIYDIKSQSVFAGGSGCACCGVTTYGYVYKKLMDGTYRRVLICATGALHNTSLILQKESIPAVCHIVCLEAS